MKSSLHHKVGPFEAFFRWCIENGYSDVAECEPKELNVKRFRAAIALYGNPKPTKSNRNRNQFDL